MVGSSAVGALNRYGMVLVDIRSQFEWDGGNLLLPQLALARGKEKTS